jgi:hypothetical protein
LRFLFFALIVCHFLTERQFVDKFEDRVVIFMVLPFVKESGPPEGMMTQK